MKSNRGHVIDTKPVAPAAPYATFYPDHTVSQASPKFGIVYHLPDSTTLKASIGKAFRYPAVTSLYHTTMSTTYIYLGNPDLKPETLLAYDAGIEHTFAQRLLARVTGYSSHADNYLQYVISGATVPVSMTMKNISSVNIRGVEAEAKYLVNRYWFVAADYTYNHSEIEKNPSNTALEGHDLPYTERHKYGTAVNFNNPRILSANFDVHYFSDSFADNWHVLHGHAVEDIKVTRAINRFVSLELGVENLADNKYQVDDQSEGTYRISPGRLLTGGLRISFNSRETR